MDLEKYHPVSTSIYRATIKEKIGTIPVGNHWMMQVMGAAFQLERLTRSFDLADVMSHTPIGQGV